jgi:hypothetical protein
MRDSKEVLWIRRREGRGREGMMRMLGMDGGLGLGRCWDGDDNVMVMNGSSGLIREQE